MKKIDRTEFIDMADESRGVCCVAVAAIGGSLVSGMMGADAAESAASTQAGAAQAASAAQLQATRESNALQWQMYQQALRNQQPFLQGGQNAYAALMGGFGLGGQYQQPVTPTRSLGLVPAGYTDVIDDGGTTGTLAVMPGTQVLNPATQTGQLTTAGGVTVNAAGQPVPTTTQYGPVQNYGATPEQMAQSAGTFAGQFSKPFAPSDLTTDPSYKWRLEQGMQQLKAAAAATGTLQTGQGLKDITNFAQNAASQEYQNAFARNMANKSFLVGNLQSLAGLGQGTAASLGQAGLSTAGNIAGTTMTGIGASNQALMGGAQAQASGMIGSANAWGGAFQGGLNNWYAQQYLNRPSGASTYGYQAPVSDATPSWVAPPTYGPQ